MVVVVVLTMKTKTMLIINSTKIMFSELGHLRNNINCVTFSYSSTFPVFFCSKVYFRTKNLVFILFLLYKIF